MSVGMWWSLFTTEEISYRELGLLLGLYDVDFTHTQEYEELEISRSLGLLQEKFWCRINTNLIYDPKWSKAASLCSLP